MGAHYYHAQPLATNTRSATDAVALLCSNAASVSVGVHEIVKLLPEALATLIDAVSSERDRTGIQDTGQAAKAAAPPAAAIERRPDAAIEQCAGQAAPLDGRLGRSGR